MAEPIGALRAEMSADAARFQRDMGKAHKAVRNSTTRMNRDFGSTGKSFDAVTSKMRTMIGVAALVAGAGALGALIKNSLNAADNIAKTADTIGISTDALQEYRFAADISGVATAELDKAMEAASKRIGELKNGTGSLTTFLQKFDQQLLQDVKSTRTTDQALGLLFRRMAETTDQTQKLALATNTFGRAGGRMTLVAGDTADKLANLRRQARDLGLVIDESLLRGAESAKDALSITAQVVRVNLTKALLRLAPVIETLAVQFTELTLSSIEFFESLAPRGFRSLQTIDKELKGAQERLEAVRAAFKPGIGIPGLIGPAGDPTKGLLEEINKLENERNDILEKRKSRKLLFDKALAEESKKSVEDFIDSLRFQNALQFETARSQAILVNLKRLDASATDRQKDRVIQLTEAIFDNAQAEKQLAEERKKAADEANRFEETNKSIQTQIDRFGELEKGAKGAGEEIDRVGEASRDLSFAVGTAFEDAILAGEGFRGVLQGILEDIQRILLRMAVTQPLEKGLGLLFSTVGTAIAGLFAPTNFTQGSVAGSMPARQHGGRITGPSLVGELGPEIYVPDRPGMILPNSTLRELQSGRSGESTNFNQIINVSPGVPETVRREIISMLPLIRAQAIQAVVDAGDRGGSVSKKMGRRR